MHIQSGRRPLSGCPALGILFFLILPAGTPLRAQGQAARVDSFTPQGTVKGVRQAQARFSHAMVPFGDPRAVEPFIVDCAPAGKARWIDERNWVFEFDAELPAGVRCTFTLRPGLRTLSGLDLSGARAFSFSTGGPAILSSRPDEGSTNLDERQVFLLELDARPTDASVLSSVYFAVERVAERVGVRILAEQESEELLRSLFPKGGRPDRPHLLLQARQAFPQGVKVSLVWGRGVSTQGGVATDRDQVLPFVTRTPLTARFHCNRIHAGAECIPFSPMNVQFSAPVETATVLRSALTGPEGRRYEAALANRGENGEFTQEILFRGPFPERAEFRLTLPPGIRDDAGRSLSNAAAFPLTVRTDEYPPLAKFSASFGILELRSNPMLPVTLRNVEPEIAARMLPVSGEDATPAVELRDLGKPGIRSTLQARLMKVPPDDAHRMLQWIKKINRRSWEDRALSVFEPSHLGKASVLSVPKLHGPKPFEVVGIPMQGAGFYVVEMQSELLGAALLARQAPMYVSATALVTNLSVHFKWGIDSSLIWVTALDSAKPVPGAAVRITNCRGETLYEGISDRSGLARTGALPVQAELPRCGYDELDGGLLVTARLRDDMAFVHSSWRDGIEPWRFRLPFHWSPHTLSVHTVFDRDLLRAGETVHMKHILRRRGTAGFAVVGGADAPGKAVVRHLGSSQKYEIPLRWDASGTAESEWKIPAGVRLGHYQVSFPRDPPELDLFSGSFRVEEFRVPLMKAAIRPPSGTLVAPSSIPVDLSVSYLAGGGAPEQDVKLRYRLEPRYLRPFDDFEGFVFSNGGVREGLVRGYEESDEEPHPLQSVDLKLDRTGSARAELSSIPAEDRPAQVLAELEFRDPNGEVQTVSSRIPVWPADVLAGIAAEPWGRKGEPLAIKLAAADPAGKPAADVPVAVDLFERRTYSHRKRLVGGFYGYEHSTETKRLGTVCEGRTDARGLLSCTTRPSVSGNIILQATLRDRSGRETRANRYVWITGGEESWFQPEDSDRMDVITELKSYEPGQTARFQVRMPFRRATVLVTVEREGVAEAFVREISGTGPVVEVPVLANYAPNAFVSVLAVRGRVAGVQPTATVDLGRPSFKLGIAEIRVGWRRHELKVRVTTDRAEYRVREKAAVRVAVTTSDGKAPPRGSEVAIAAVDEGLLELSPNRSWQLLESMMGRRGIAVSTSTAQTHVVGKRHFGLKALPSGGGGGSQATRELFDTLLLWQGRVPLDPSGHATVSVPLNDSLTAFRIVAIATGGAEMFGTGSTTIRTTQDLMILSGIVPVVRQGDRYNARFTLRNTTARELDVEIEGRVREMAGALKPASIRLAAGESKDLSWQLVIPESVDALRYEIEARAQGIPPDRLSVSQKVVPAVPVRPVQATLTQVEGETRLEIEKPADSLAGRGGVRVSLQPTILAGLEGIRTYMARYPYTCLEQKISQAVTLRDESLWQAVVGEIGAHLDGEGLLKYFPTMLSGSEVLTSYLISIAHEAGWQVPGELKEPLLNGLRGFIEGRIVRRSSLPTADLTVRKLAAIEALSREGKAEPSLLSSIVVDPNLWPTSAVIDWRNILARMSAARNRQARLEEADRILRSRLELQGTLLSFSTERTDNLWWLMASADVNAARLLLAAMDSPGWSEEMPRMMRGAVMRQRRGHWDTTTANAWGVLAMEKFARRFESGPVTGASRAAFAGRTESLDWSSSPAGGTFSFDYPDRRSTLVVGPAGTGRPWVTVQNLAAIPLKEPWNAGFTVRKTLIPVEQRDSGGWSRGDIVRIRLELESRSDMTWVVVSDPIPAGAGIFGTGLGRDSRLARRGEEREGWVWPAFEERSNEAFRSYYEYVPRGSWTIEYTVRLNNEGTFQVPPTRVEAMYAPEMFAEAPNPPMIVR